MKYKVVILLAVLAVAALLVAGFAVPASAVIPDQPGGHDVMVKKILGVAAFGADNLPFMEVPSRNAHQGNFVITNPSCSCNITLQKMQVIRGYDHALIYKGVVFGCDLAGNRYRLTSNSEINNILMPHQSIFIPLSLCFPAVGTSANPLVPGQWITYTLATLPPVYTYTLEAQYSCATSGVKPIGWINIAVNHKYNDSGSFVGITCADRMDEMKVYP